MSDDAKPLIAIVTGRPGAGKSTLARTISEAVRCPLISRDRLKEGRLRTTGLSSPDHDTAAREVYAAFFQSIELLAAAGVSLVAEAAFQHRLWSPKLEPLLPVADIRIIVCEVSAEVASTRRTERAQQDPNWNSYHPEFPAESLILGAYEAPKINVPTLAVDTSAGYLPEFEAILKFLS